MGRTARKPATSKADKTTKKAARSGIPKYAYLAKSVLAAYPDEEGNALWLGMKDSVAELLAPENLVEKANNKNTEMLARPGLALSLAAAATHHGAKAVVKGSAKKALDVLAIELKKPEGQAFLQAVKDLNLGKQGTPSRATVRKAIQGHVKYLKAAGSELQTALVDVAATSAKVYLFAMHCLEQKALLGKPTAFAKKWRRSSTQPKELRDWLKAPGDSDVLEEALANMVMAKVASHKQAAKAESPAEPASPKPAALHFSSDDEESEGAEDLVATAMAQWDAGEAAVLAHEVAAGLLNIKDKNKRLSLSALVALLDNIPAKVLVEAGLSEAHAGLKKLQRLPKEEKVQDLLRRLEELCTVRASMAATEGSSEDRDNWSVKVLMEDRKLQAVDPNTAQASECESIALVRKGG
ncbi:unnamed protein product [Symbiodinium sp. CCMP2456]|nr:unnamed protein product [Symbiodinium sp. CCMP2456]